MAKIILDEDGCDSNAGEPLHWIEIYRHPDPAIYDRIPIRLVFSGNNQSADGRWISREEARKIVVALIRSLIECGPNEDGTIADY